MTWYLSAAVLLLQHTYTKEFAMMVINKNRVGVSYDKLLLYVDGESMQYVRCVRETEYNNCL